MGDPVCLVQWLKAGEYREVARAFAQFSGALDITLHDVQTKAQAAAAVRAWLDGNDNSQFLYIGAHGVHDAGGRYLGIGADGADIITWRELADLLAPARVPPVLWLGACGSSAVASAWSPIVDKPPAEWVTCFPTPSARGPASACSCGRSEIPAWTMSSSSTRSSRACARRSLGSPSNNSIPQ